MFSRKFALEEGKPERLEISFGKKNIVKLDGKEVISVDGDTLKKGVRFSLDDGSVIDIKRVWSNLFLELQVLRNGSPVPCSDTEPAQKIKIESYILFALGGLSILVGLVFMAIFPEMSGLLGLVILGGIIYFIMGTMIKQRSKIAVAASIVLVAISGISSINIGQWSSLILVALIIIYLIRGYGAIDELERNETARAGQIKTTASGGK